MVGKLREEEGGGEFTGERGKKPEKWGKFSDEQKENQRRKNLRKEKKETSEQEGNTEEGNGKVSSSKSAADLLIELKLKQGGKQVVFSPFSCLFPFYIESGLCNQRSCALTHVWMRIYWSKV